MESWIDSIVGFVTRYLQQIADLRGFDLEQILAGAVTVFVAGFGGWAVITGIEKVVAPLGNVKESLILLAVGGIAGYILLDAVMFAESAKAVLAGLAFVFGAGMANMKIGDTGPSTAFVAGIALGFTLAYAASVTPTPIPEQVEPPAAEAPANPGS